MRLPLVPPFAVSAMLDALRSHTVAGHERHDAQTRTHSRAVRGRGGPAVVSVTFENDPDAAYVTAWIDATDDRDVPELEQCIRTWLDLDAASTAIDAALGADPLLAPFIAARPGLRVLGSTDWFATAVQTVVGQQVSLAAGATFATRLVAAYGENVSDGLRCFPTAQRLAGIDPDELKTTVRITGVRSRTVHALANAAANGLDPVSGPEFRADLLALPGIGPWTVDYLSLRALGDRDAFPSGDLVLRRALGGISAGEATARAETWRPWRAYAVSHLWTHAAYTTSRTSSSPAAASSSDSSA
ncbi:DNA-3-methyladenine glycosylase 2 family protein [Rhodococcus sp. HNM0563]|uniref:DNA-3-methyladenine glycosylase family protein n=1 Tax=Rhodococcus sp. HNM0563 TaxID=2716339 RepID=UPI00146EFFC4|nr:DNA-3-methyladenine glycosylase 2 family protein [Rhodococcus sp. HNM0563]NLU65501.1 DNA-3-methyladenine glycosylase 2 family protein [Rhodococcus sp. HNM0563]